MKADTMYSKKIQGIKLNNIPIYEVPGSGTTETTSIKTTGDVDNSGLFLMRATTSSKDAAAREVPYRYRLPKNGLLGPTEPY